MYFHHQVPLCGMGIGMKKRQRHWAAIGSKKSRVGAANGRPPMTVSYNCGMAVSGRVRQRTVPCRIRLFWDHQYYDERKYGCEAGLQDTIRREGLRASIGCAYD